MTPVEITAAITGVKTALEIAKTILSINKDVAINEKASELLQVTISLQKSIIELQSKYDEIKKSRDDINKKYIESLDWKATASQYDLEEIHSGVFVYSPNKTHKSPKPNHWFCTNCFGDKKESILQFDKKVMSHNQYICPKCKNIIRIPSKQGGIQAVSFDIYK